MRAFETGLLVLLALRGEAAEPAAEPRPAPPRVLIERGEQPADEATARGCEAALAAELDAGGHAVLTPAEVDARLEAIRRRAQSGRVSPRALQADAAALGDLADVRVAWSVPAHRPGQKPGHPRLEIEITRDGDGARLGRLKVRLPKGATGEALPAACRQAGRRLLPVLRRLAEPRPPRPGKAR